MYLLTVCTAALCAAACVSTTSAQRDSKGDATTTGRYDLMKSSLYWTDAYKTCKERSSHLAVINSQEEADNLLTLMKIYDLQYIHVGLTDLYEKGRYVSILDEDLATIGYNTWREGYPNKTQGNCVAFRRTPGPAGLMNIACTTAMKSFCEERRWDGYDSIPGHNYYKMHGEVRSWPEARRLCRQEGAHLFIIDSKEELTAVYNRLRHSWAFVGVTDIMHTGLYVTMHNDPLEKKGFSTWASSNPVNDINNPFSSVYVGYWLYSEHINSRLPFICEHERLAG